MSRLVSDFDISQYYGKMSNIDMFILENRLPFKKNKNIDMLCQD